MNIYQRSDNFIKANWSFNRLIVGICVLLVYIIIYHVSIIPFLKNGDPKFYTLFVNWSLSFLWMASFPLLCLNRDNLLKIKVQISQIVKEGIIAVGIVIVAIIIGGIVNALVYSLLQEPAAVRNPWSGFGNSPASSSLMLLLFMMIILAPIAEEIFFRGFIYNALRQRLNIYTCIILQAIIFATFHYKNPYDDIYSLISIFIVGIILVLAYEWRKSIVSPILVHSFYTLFGVSLQRALGI